MRFIQSLSFALAALTAVVSAQSNPIIFPGTGDSIAAGTDITIRWKPTTEAPISLQLRYGDASNLAPGPPIVVEVPNTGSYSWEVPSSIASGQWTIEIKDGSGNQNFSPRFSVTGGTGTQGSTGITTTKTFASSGAPTPRPTGSSSSSSASTTSGSSSASSSMVSSRSSTSSAASQTQSRAAAPSAGAAVKDVAGVRFAAAVGLGALVVLA